MQNRWMIREKRRSVHYTGPETNKSALQELRCSAADKRPKVKDDIFFWLKNPEPET